MQVYKNIYAKSMARTIVGITLWWYKSICSAYMGISLFRCRVARTEGGAPRGSRWWWREWCCRSSQNFIMVFWCYKGRFRVERASSYSTQVSPRITFPFFYLKLVLCMIEALRKEPHLEGIHESKEYGGHLYTLQLSIWDLSLRIM